MVKRILLLSLSLLFLTSCGGRLPSAQTAHTIITKHFQKYGKKYKQSDFGKYAIEKVEIVSLKELQKDLAEAEALVSLKDGPTCPVRVTIEKKSLRWRYQAWEMLKAPEK